MEWPDNGFGCGGYGAEEPHKTHKGSESPSTPCCGAWISVDDKLPKDSKVIVSYKFGVGEALSLNGKFWICGTEVPEVTHWMPLPEAP